MLQDQKPYHPLAIANYFVSKGIDSSVEVTPMKLIKMVFIAHGIYLANTGEPLINETVEAWKFGPVIPSVYHAFKEYRVSPVKKMASAHVVTSDLGVHISTPMVHEEAIRGFLDKVWTLYSKYTGTQLSALTHMKETPWDIVWNMMHGSERESAQIGNDIIKWYYSNLIKTKPSSDAV